MICQVRVAEISSLCVLSRLFVELGSYIGYYVSNSQHLLGQKSPSDDDLSTSCLFLVFAWTYRYNTRRLLPLGTDRLDGWNTHWSNKQLGYSS